MSQPFLGRFRLVVFLVVIDDFDAIYSVLLPGKTDPPSLVDSYAVLAGPVPFERFQSIARRHVQLIKPDHGIELHQFPEWQAWRCCRSDGFARFRTAPWFPYPQTPESSPIVYRAAFNSKGSTWKRGDVNRLKLLQL